MDTKHPYPTILQGFLISFIYAGFLVLFTFMFNRSGSDEAKLIIRLVACVATFMVMHGLRKRHNGIASYNFSPAPPLVIFSVLIAWCMLILLMMIFPYLFPEIEQMDYIVERHRSKNMYALLSVALVAPVFEELLFRGIILDGFLKRYRPTVAIFWSALIFGVAHLDPVQGTAAFFVGLLLGWLFWKTGSLFLCMLMHILNNLLAKYDFGIADDNETIREVFTPIEFSLFYGCAILLFVASIWYINRYYKHKMPSGYQPVNV